MEAKYAVVPKKALLDNKLGRIEKLVLAALCCYQNHDGKMWPFQSTIAAGLGVDIRTVQRGIKGLVRAGWLLMQYKRASHQIIYEVLWEQATPVSRAHIVEGTRQQDRVPPDHATPVSLAGDTGVPHKITSELDQHKPTKPVTTSSLRSEDGSLSEADSPKTPEVLGAGGNPESSHGRANSSEHSSSVAAAAIEGQARGERLLRGGTVNTAGSSSWSPPRSGGKNTKGSKKPPDPAAVEALSEFAAAYKRVLGFEFFVGPQQLGQMRTLVKRCGREQARAICDYVLERWPELGRRWRVFGHPDLGIIMMRVQSIWGEMSGKKGLSPTQTRDERTDAQQAARERMYADTGGPIHGMAALMGSKPPSVAGR